jgi:hypothetical protein
MMIEGLFRLIPRSVIPGLVSMVAWFGFVYAYVADEFYYRATLPHARSMTENVVKYADSHGAIVERARVATYVRCVYDEALEQEGARVGFALYIASFGMASSRSLKAMDVVVPAIAQSGVCGERPWKQ